MTARQNDPQSEYTSFLSLRAERLTEQTQNAGEMYFQEFNISYASIRVRARLRGAPGAVAGIFTYLNDTQESDIEMLTRDSGRYIQYTNQPTNLGPPTFQGIPGATSNISLPLNADVTKWHTHRLDWTPGRSVFFLDDQQINSNTVNVPVADPPSKIYINMWSAQSAFTGRMDVGKNATLDIQWIELLFNTTSSARIPCTQNTCSIDT